MTTIIWRKDKNGKLTIAADKRSTICFSDNSWSTSKIVDNQTKIYKFEDKKNSYNSFLLWIAWDSMSNILVNEISKTWAGSEEWKHWVDSVVTAIQFLNCLKENSNKKDPDNAFMLLHKNFQIEMSSIWQVSEMKWNVMSIWSWCFYFDSIRASEALAKTKFNIDNFELEDYFEIISTLDPYTSSTFEVLTLD